MATATAPAPSDSATNQDWKPELHEIPVDQVDVGANVRADVGDITELAASIESNGLLSPIRVAEAGAGRYELVYGQRRLAAAKHIGLKTLPAIVDATAKPVIDRTVAQLLENLQREDLNALDTAKAYRSILDHDISQRELAGLLGISQPTIANTLAVLKQPEAIQERIGAGELTRSHVEVLAKLPVAEREEVARRVVEHGLSTRQLEEEISLAAARQSDEDRRRDERKNAEATRLATVIDLLAAKKVDRSKVTLVGYIGTAGDVLEKLKPLGWKTKLNGDYATLTKGICDCTALRLEFRYEWPGGKQVEKASLAKACISPKHQDAARKAEREAFEAQQAEQREIERKAAEERKAMLAPLVAAVSTPIPPAKAKLLLFTLLGGADRGNGYWIANDWAGRELRYDGWRQQLWERIDALAHEKLLTEIATIVAEAVVDAGGKVQVAIDALLNSPEAAQTRVAEKRAARTKAKS